MDVHHHAHTSRKKWTHYFWEFLMLFLAVFCGFLAEYQLEHMIEHQREKQYMRTLLADLSADTATINKSKPLKLQRVASIDTVFDFFKNNQDAKTITGKLFKSFRRTNFDFRFIRTTVTIDQLKHAGGMRLIRKKIVADSISSYDLRCESILSLYNELYLISSQNAARQFERMFSSSDLLPFYISNTGEAIVANIPDSIKIRINPAGLNELLNFMMQQKAYARQEMNRYAEIKESAVRLMGLIEEEYGLER